MSGGEERYRLERWSMDKLLELLALLGGDKNGEKKVRTP